MTTFGDDYDSIRIEIIELLKFARSAGSFYLA
jgi:hypothetical protein